MDVSTNSPRTALSILAVATLLAIAAIPTAPARGGVNADSHADIVFATVDRPASTVCLGSANGSYSCSDVPTGVSNDRGVAIGYIDGDSRLDAIFASIGGRNRVCLGNGAGGLSCSDVSADENPSTNVALADVNHDGNSDAIFSNFLQQTNRICLGNGTGGFACSELAPDTDNSNDVAAGDLDGDGHVDAVFANESVPLDVGEANKVCFGDGTGGFGCAPIGGLIGESIDVAIGDIDNDSDLDVVFAENSSPNTVCVNLGGRSFSCNAMLTSIGNARGVALGDVDSDGTLDAVFAYEAQQNRVCIGDGVGGFTCTWMNGDTNDSWDVELADVDRDGDLDAVFANLGQRDRLCRGDGAGGFACSDISTDEYASHNLAVAAGKRGTFSDDDSSIFEADIEWLAAKGITKGCNPPTNDRFCPDDPVTRGQMAAFLYRALDLADAQTNPFVDVGGTGFETEISAVAAADITKGCVPDGTRFCPNDPVTRGQMAAFLHRALGP